MISDSAGNHNKWWLRTDPEDNNGTVIHDC